MYVALYSGYIGHNLNLISLIVMTVGVISIVKNEYCNITFEIFLAQTWIYNAKTLWGMVECIISDAMDMLSQFRCNQEISEKKAENTSE